LFIATPSLNSVSFPSRKGTLNFYDDHTHKNPIDLLHLANNTSHEIEVLHFSSNSKPFFWYFIGFLNELRSNILGKVLLGTWDYYGFEQIIWIKKI